MLIEITDTVWQFVIDGMHVVQHCFLELTFQSTVSIMHFYNWISFIVFLQWLLLNIKFGKAEKPAVVLHSKPLKISEIFTCILY